MSDTGIGIGFAAIDGVEIDGSDGSDGVGVLLIYPELFDAALTPPAAGAGTIGSVLDVIVLIGTAAPGTSDIAYVPAVPDFTTVAAVPDLFTVPPGRKP